MADQTRVRRVRFAIETGLAAFGVDQSSTFTTYDLRTEEFDATLDAAIVEDMRVVSHTYEKPLALNGLRSASGTLPMHLTATGVPLDTAATATKTALIRLLEVQLGGYQGAAGSAVTAGSTTTVVNVTAGHGNTRFAVGTVVMISGEVRRVTAVAANSITVAPALSTAPAAAVIVYNSQTVFPTSNPLNSLQLLIEHLSNASRRYLTGVSGALSFDLQIGAIPKAQLAFNAANWFLPSEMLTAPTAALAATYDDVLVDVVRRGALRVGTTTLVAQPYSSFAFTPNITDEVLPFHGGVEGKLRRHRVVGDAGTVEFTIPYEDDTFLTAWTARTVLTAQYVLNVAPGQVIAFDFPRCQVNGPPQIVAVGGIRSLRVSMRLLGATDDTVTDLGRKPFSISFL